MIMDTHAMSVHEREIRRSESQIRLDNSRSQFERNRLGQFATPNQLAIDITTYLLSLLDEKEPIRFLEPALGSGSFYSALLQVAAPDRIESANGFELDPRFSDLAKELWGDIGLKVIEGDYTENYKGIKDSNVVLTNPPYVRHHHVDSFTKSRLQSEAGRAFGLSINGLSGLYVYFMALAHTNMANGGVAAWLVPSEFMDVNYGSVLRSYLSQKVQLLRIHRFDPDDVQFNDALVSSAVVVFRKTTPNINSKACFTFGGNLLEPRQVQEVSLELLSQRHKWTTFPSLKPMIEWDKQITIGDLFEIRRGIATGANSYFIMSKDKAHELGIPNCYLKPILPSPRYLVSDVILEGDDGQILLDHQMVLLDCDLSEEILHDKYPQLGDYILDGIKMGVKNRYLPSRRSPWYRQEQRPPAPFLSTYMGRGSGEIKPFRFIWNRSKATATNVYLLLYPKPFLERIIRTDDKAALVHEGLNGLEADELREEGRVYGGGLYKIEPRELKRMSATSLIDRLPELAAASDITEVSAHDQTRLFGLK